MRPPRSARVSNSSGKQQFVIVMIMIIMGLTAAVSAGILNSDDIKSSGGGPSSVHINVENFGKVTDFYYRGAQPGEADYEQLSALGIKTVIDLRDDPRDYARPDRKSVV